MDRLLHPVSPRGPRALPCNLHEDAPRLHGPALHLGCGPCAAPGWLNCDLRPAPGLQFCADLRRGLPLASGSLGCIAAIHLLQDLAYGDVVPALRELHRVLHPAGVLRLGLPDLDKAVRAYLAGDAGYFYVPDGDATRLGAKLVTQIIWYGSVRTPFNEDFARETLHAAGFDRIERCRFGETRSGIAGLCSLDNRERESFFIEAWK